MDLIEAAGAIGGMYRPKETPVVLPPTYSVTVRTKDGVAAWGGIAMIEFNPYAIILRENNPDGGTRVRAAYAHGHWESFQQILEAQAEGAKE